MTAVATRQQQDIHVSPNKFSAESKQAGMVSTPQGTVALVALVESERIEVQQVETTVIINGIYNRTNHYIRQSRDFVGGAKLTCYANFPALISLSVVAMLVSLASPVHYIIGFVMAGIDVIWLCIFIQHMYVNVKTMPHMLKLPRMPNHMHRSKTASLRLTLRSTGQCSQNRRKQELVLS